MPRKTEFIQDKNYLSVINLFSEKRSLNTIEIGYINEAIEYNIFTMQLVTGFSYFSKLTVKTFYSICGIYNSANIIW